MEQVDRVAEAVLYEGFLLYPYRHSALKNQQRWTFGGVYPRAYSEANVETDPWYMQTECLLTGTEKTTLDVRVRFLQVVRRRVDAIRGDTRRAVNELRIGDRVYRPWEEAVERTVAVGTSEDKGIALATLLSAGCTEPIDIPDGSEEEPLVDSSGEQLGALVRAWGAIRGKIQIGAKQVEVAGYRDPLYRLKVRITNSFTWSQDPPARRETALQHTMVSTHTILHIDGGLFVSLLEPPDELLEIASSCENIKTWPVLVGDQGERHTMLSSPIILHDYPQISPESQGNYFDATEIDELLALSVLTLTEDEKQEMRETDPRAREILERTESLSPEQLMQLHGSVRGLQSLRGEET